MSNSRTPKTIPVIENDQSLFVHRRGALLIVLYGDELGKKFYLEEGNNVFGRSLGCDFVIDNPSVSRQHFSVTKNQENYLIQEKGSTNGTFVNGIKLNKSTKLNSTDFISVGNVILKFLKKEDSDLFFKKEFYKLSTMDPITDAYNRQYFLDILSKEVERSLRYHRNLSVIRLVIKNFDSINVSYGKAAGNAVLRGIATMLMNNIRKQDILSRDNDNSMSIILPETFPEKAQLVRDRIAIGKENFNFHLNSETCVLIDISLASASLSEKTGSVINILKELSQQSS